MGRKRSRNKNTLILLILLVLVGVGIAYAVLTETLTINNTVSYDAMKWDVGFTSAEDGWETYVDAYIKMMEQESGVTLEEQGLTREEMEIWLLDILKENRGVYSESTASISSDRKSITTNCNLPMSTMPQICFVKATIVNDSTFNVVFSETPIFMYDEKYIFDSMMIWTEHELYGDLSSVSKWQTLEPGESANILIAIFTSELTEDMLPSTVTSVPVTIDLNFEEIDYPVKDLALLTSRQGDYAFWFDTYRNNIKNITFEDKINISDNAVETWDVSFLKNGKIMAYVVPNINDSNYYDLYIQSDEQIYTNFNMSSWFEDFNNLDSINGLELLDTRYTNDMSYMFESTGYNSEVFTLDVSNFDTSNVTNMGHMFFNTGYNSTKFTLDVNSFETSNVIDMYGMFAGTGASNTSFTLDVSNFDTCKVTDMSNMFSNTGYSSTVFKLDVSNFDTRKVTDMSSMFNGAGYNSTIFTLDVSSFDTSNVTDMSLMFFNAGYNSTEFDLDLEGFDTSKVETMQWMLWDAGYNSTKFVTDITIKNPNVQSYDYMFSGVATKTGSKITVNYTSETSDLVDRMIATKSTNSNVVKGIQVD